MPQSGSGKIRLFHDFCGVGNTLALTAVTAQIGDFYAGGEGFADGDAGIAGKDALSGVVTITSANTDADTSFIGTHLMFDVGLMGTIVLEARVQLPDFDTKEIFFGLTSILTTSEQLEDIVINSSSTAITMPADLVAFYFSDELTASATEWHGIYNGGSATASTTVADVNLGTTGSANPTAGEYQILRLEVESNGTVRWYIDKELVQTVTGAVSTTTDYAVCLAAAANTTQLAIFDCDYLLVRAGRDWNL